jgi:hypothetical protein
LLNLQIAPNKADRSLSISGRANAEPPPFPLAIKGGAGGGGGGGGGDGTVEPAIKTSFLVTAIPSLEAVNTENETVPYEKHGHATLRI